MMRGRRRQNLLAVCLLMVVAGGFLQPRVTHLPADRRLSGRRLMHITLQVSTHHHHGQLYSFNGVTECWVVMDGIY